MKQLIEKQKKVKSKAQSAMEYLMTYGWAILIIAVILAALDFLGVFNTGTFIGSSCLATPGYLCSNPVMTANANGPNLLLFNFKQDSGETLYNVSFACAASSTSQGYPNVNVNSGFNTSSNLTVLTSGSSVTVSGLECYTSNGNLFKDNPIGAVFSGTLWIRYNLQGYPSSEYQYAKIAKITAKVESEAAISAMQSSPTQLTFSSLNPSSPSIDTGKSITLTVSWLGGVSPFTANWLSGASAGSMSLLSSHTGIVSSSLSDSLSVAPTSNTYYSANVIDSSTPPNVVSSPLDLVTVNPALSAPSISASSTALVTGQSVTFSSSWTGGTAPYIAKLYSSTTLPCTSLSSLVQTETTSSNSISFPAITPASTAYYCIYVNDSSYHSSETENSITQEVTDTTPSNILYYVPITITNSQSVATSAPFQQMINITESSFSSYLTYNSNFANFEFFTQSGAIIPAWIENNDSGKLITWVNLPNSIQASNSMMIYLGFAGSNNLLSSSGTTGIGEAPQLSQGKQVANLAGISAINTNTILIPTSTKTFTESAWINFAGFHNSFTGNQMEIAGEGIEANPSPYNGIYGLAYSDWYSSTQPSILFGFAGCGNINTGSSFNPTTNTWYNVVAIYNNSTSTSNSFIYINGVKYASGHFPLCNGYNPPKSIKFNFVIGADNNSTTDFFNGSIADVQLYSSDLSSNQVNQIYSQGVGGSPIAGQSLIGYWPLNDTFQDLSGNGHKGTATGFLTFYGLGNYAEYDDGAKVFTNYWNFAGITSPSGWSGTNICGSTYTGEVKVNNRLSFTGGSDSCEAYKYTSLAYSQPLVFESIQHLIRNVSNVGGSDVGAMILTGSPGTFWESGLLGANTTPVWYYQVNAGSPQPVNAIHPTGWNIYGVGDAATKSFDSFNYIQENSTNELLSSFNIATLQMGANAVAESYWARLRTYPPNSIMPSVTFGSVN